MKKAFTLIELLVVVAIIALLLSIIVPALRMAKMKASSAVCLTNTKNLSLGWYMYKEDNDGRIMSAQMDGVEPDGTRVGWIGQPYNTTAGDRGITATSPAVTDEDEIRGAKEGILHGYLKSPDVYHCPGDKLRKSKYDLTPVFVSYVIPSCLYGFTSPSNAMYNKQIRRYGEITSPGTRYVFVESAEERNWNMSGWFSLGAPEWTGNGTWGWWGPMAVNHGDSSTLGFVDGHAELRKWRDNYTRERVTKLSSLDTTTYNIEYPPAGQTEDLEYMARGWAYRNR